jgi:hypothetical protein
MKIIRFIAVEEKTGSSGNKFNKLHPFNNKYELDKFCKEKGINEPDNRH